MLCLSLRSYRWKRFQIVAINEVHLFPLVAMQADSRGVKRSKCVIPDFRTISIRALLRRWNKHLEDLTSDQGLVTNESLFSYNWNIKYFAALDRKVIRHLGKFASGKDTPYWNLWSCSNYREKIILPSVWSKVHSQFYTSSLMGFLRCDLTLLNPFFVNINVSA